jgi:hypothetical protein
MPVLRRVGASGAGPGPNAVRPYNRRLTPQGRLPFDSRSPPLAVPPTLPRIVIGGWDDKGEEFFEKK